MVSEPTALAADTQLEDRTTGGQSYLETPPPPPVRHDGSH